MTDDFQLFPEPGGARATGADACEADTALITAFLAGELTLVQSIAVEERLSTDSAFRRNVQPIIEAWLVPGALGPRAEANAPAATSLSGAEISAGWKRIAEPRLAQKSASGAAHRVRPSANPWKTWLSRAAAVVAIALVPMLAVAQVVRYVVVNPTAPGHVVAARIVAALGWSGPHREVPAVELGPAAVAKARGELRLDDWAPRRQLEAAPSRQQNVPIVDLAPTARTTRTFKGIYGAKELSNGQLIVNDVRARQLLIVEPDLGSVAVALDSVPGSTASYGRIGFWPLLPFSGDSALLFDGETETIRVLDGRGRVVRSIAPPGGGLLLAGLPAAVDGKGRMTVQTPRDDAQMIQVPLAGLMATPKPATRAGAGGPVVSSSMIGRTALQSCVRTSTAAGTIRSDSSISLPKEWETPIRLAGARSSS
jgi:hypothetical protein